MSKFSYKARDKSGSLIQGIIESESIGVARQKIAGQGLIPIHVEKAKANVDLKLENIFKFKVPTQELLLFTKQFYTLFRAGMGIESILNTLSGQMKNKSMKDALLAIKQDIHEGSSLASSFSKHPLVFDELYVSMLASGEEAGILDEVLEQISILLEKDHKMKKGIKAATLYPKIVVFVLVIATIILMTAVIPQFVTMFGKKGADLPLPTVIMITASHVFRKYGWLLALICMGIFMIYKKYYATPKGRLNVDKLKLKIPIFGPLTLKVGNARFANIMASLYKSGIPITKGLEITAGTIGNEAFARDVKVLQADVEKGNSIAESMRKSKYFSPIIVEAASIGEKSGSLDSMFKSISEHFDMEIDYTVKNLSTYIEPVLLGFIFMIVAVFMLAIFLPMLEMNKLYMK